MFKELFEGKIKASIELKVIEDGKVVKSEVVNTKAQTTSLSEGFNILAQIEKALKIKQQYPKHDKNYVNYDKMQKNYMSKVGYAGEVKIYVTIYNEADFEFYKKELKKIK